MAPLRRMGQVQRVRWLVRDAEPRRQRERRRMDRNPSLLVLACHSSHKTYVTSLACVDELEKSEEITDDARF